MTEVERSSSQVISRSIKVRFARRSLELVRVKVQIMPITAFHSPGYTRKPWVRRQSEY